MADRIHLLWAPEHASSALGPLLFGVVSAATGSPRLAMLSLGVFLIGGAAVLATVNIPQDTRTDQG
jgi:MFS-type transporter involved in bile tolerance (Atg22 family)